MDVEPGALARIARERGRVFGTAVGPLPPGATGYEHRAHLGLSDIYVWLQTYPPRADGLRCRVLPCDWQLRRKPAWNAIAGALGAEPRGADAAERVAGSLI